MILLGPGYAAGRGRRDCAGPRAGGAAPRDAHPQVVVLLAGGVLIGPEVLDWASRPAIDLLANVGLGFLLAGYELDLHLFRERPGRLVMVAWLVSVGVAVALVGALAAAGLVHAFVPVALGLTTTALGTLLPILRDNDMLGGRFGRYLLAAGAVGELFPIFAIALLFGPATSSWPSGRWGRLASWPWS